MKLYTKLASWRPLVSPPSHYVQEAADLLPTLMEAADATPHTLLELGCGGGSLAFHFKAHVRIDPERRLARDARAGSTR